MYHTFFVARLVGKPCGSPTSLAESQLEVVWQQPQEVLFLQPLLGPERHRVLMLIWNGRVHARSCKYVCTQLLVLIALSM